MARSHQKCPACQTSFGRAHHAKSHTDSMAKLKCPQCGDSFSRSDLLSKHTTKRHPHENTATITTIVTLSTDLNAMPLHIPAVRRPTIRVPPLTKGRTFAFSPKPLSQNILNNSTWNVTCNPNPCGLPPFDPDTSTSESMDEWLEAFWPGFIGATLSTELKQAPEPKDGAQAGTDSHPSNSESKGVHRLDPQDLEGRLAALSQAKLRARSPTSASASRCGSPNSAHTRASSLEGSPWVHISGTTRGVQVVPSGYPTPPN